MPKIDLSFIAEILDAQMDLLDEEMNEGFVSAEYHNGGMQSLKNAKASIKLFIQESNLLTEKS